MAQAHTRPEAQMDGRERNARELRDMLLEGFRTSFLMKKMAERDPARNMMETELEEAGIRRIELTLEQLQYSVVSWLYKPYGQLVSTRML